MRMNLATSGGNFSSLVLQPPPPAVPEPASWARMLLGFAAVSAVRRTP
jgi:PEP-CTERM motif